MATTAGRSRKLVRVIRNKDGTYSKSENGKGKEVAGLHFHASNRSYYRILPNGKRQFYGRDLGTALKRFVDDGNPLPWQRQVTLKDLHITVDRDHLEQTLIDVIRPPFENPDQLSTPQLRQMLGQIQRMLGGSDEAPPSNERLSDCWTVWESNATTKGVKASTIKDVGRYFDRLQKLLRNKPINQLTEADVENWRNHVAVEGKKRSNDWIIKHHKYVRQVFCDVRIIKTGWAFPDKLWLWLDVYKKTTRKAVVSKDNKQPMPPADFQKLINRCNVLIGEGNRDGYQLKAILMLVVNCGLDNVDVCRLRPDHLVLNTDNPILDFARSKVAWNTGALVERLIPLLPPTVAALKEWIAFEKDSTGTIFRTAGQGSVHPPKPFDKSDLSKQVKRLRDDAKVKQSLKHLRNVPTTVAKESLLPIEMADYILGHTQKGIAERYTGDMLKTYAQPLVDKIGEKYFDVQEK